MKRIIFSLSTFATVATLLLTSQSILAQQVNSLYFLEKTPFHTKWNPAMAPSRSGIGVPGSSIGFSFRSDLAFSDIFYPSADGSTLLNVLHPDLPQTDKDAFLENMGTAADFGMSMNMDLFNLGLKMGKMYITLGSSMVSDFGVGMPKDLFKLIMSGPGTSGTLDLKEMNINSMTYLKTGAGLSLKLSDKLSIGGTVNYLMGVSDIRLGFDEFSVNATGSSWDVTTKGNLKVIAPEFIQLKYDSEDYIDFQRMNEIIDNSYFETLPQDLQNDFMGTLPTAGTGLSFDFGLTYKPLNFLTLSAAVLDMGSIKWKQECINQATSDGSFTYSGTDLSSDAEETDPTGTLVDMMHLKKVDSPEAYSSSLTTKVNIGAEIGLPSNKLSFGVLSQTGISENGKYQDFMFSANLKPMSLIQTAFTYSLLHGAMSSFGAAVNVKLLFLNLYVAADYIPLKVNPQYIPINNSYFNLQTGFNLMF